MSRTRLFGSLCALVFLVNFARVVFAPLVGEFIDAFGIREGTAGLIVTLAWLGSAAPRLPAGWALTRFTRRSVIVVSGAMLTAGALGVALAPSVLALMVAAFAVGLASGVYFVAANPFISELFPQRVGRVMGVHGMASQLSAVIAAPAVTVALWYDWRYAFYALALAAAASTVLFVALAKRTDLPDAGASDTDFLAAARGEWKLILAGVVLMGLTSFVWQGLFNFYELYMIDKGLGRATARNLLTVIFAAGVPAFLVSGDLADRLPHVPYLLGIVTAFVGGVVLVVVAEGLAAVIAASVVVGFAIHMLFPAGDTYLLASLPDESRASAYAMFSAGMMSTQAAGSWVVGEAIEAGAGYDAVFLALAGGLVVLVAAYAALYRLGRVPGGAAGATRAA
ncbi:MFS transporter [Halorubrum distributum]|uniref:Major facilitator superfamily MFS_1 n=3 Tax=Halorubrum distributum TaxID=29283 RepID=M0PR61_9EURY|nr:MULTISPECIES: MFS transporter [Halorubrum distributum group]PHQ46071.1 MFS transporter [Halorubrum sp. C3]ELZ35234.1 major facilitator superfamily MFS_1 [Halorubrum terrestre JCM 10247]EMA72503.1 major facilitator superfamily MFS_1 [Halorubrum arcis JCM 13916]MYL16382.1 MFS transporter [Halorubrum terrestre]MYL67061.1 MFS transporter [Halorubrum terrestre]